MVVFTGQWYQKQIKLDTDMDEKELTSSLWHYLWFVPQNQQIQICSPILAGVAKYPEAMCHNLAQDYQKSFLGIVDQISVGCVHI